MEIYDQNVKDILGMEQELYSLKEVNLLHDRMLDLRKKWYFDGTGDFMPFYRCEQNFGWDLTPGLFRENGASLSPVEGKRLEQKAISEFEVVVTDKLGPKIFRQLFNHTPNGKNWDLLFQAQHGSIHTSLVDWSRYIAPSLFFGVEESLKEKIESAEAQLWVYMLPEYLFLNDKGARHKESYLAHDPFNLMKGFMTNVPIYMDDLEERIYEQRISRQGGSFYVSPNDRCNIPMNKQPEIAKLLFRFRIPAKFKPVFRDELNHFKINRTTIYVKENPDHFIWTKEINMKIYGF